MYYYGLRFLTTSQGRWLSRDPIGERGGKGLYVFVKNCLPNRFDPYGLADSEWAIVNQSINDGWDLAKEVRSREWQRRVEDPDTVETFHKEIRKWWWAESCQCCRVQRYDATVEDIRKWHHTEHKQEEQKYEEKWEITYKVLEGLDLLDTGHTVIFKGGWAAWEAILIAGGIHIAIVESKKYAGWGESTFSEIEKGGKEEDKFAAVLGKIVAVERNGDTHDAEYVKTKEACESLSDDYFKNGGSE